MPSAPPLLEFGAKAMAEDEASTATEDDADECLHCAIVDMVDERIAAGGADAANLAALIAESLVDPPVPINKTIRPDYILSLEDGRQYKSMKRHLSSRGL